MVTFNIFNFFTELLTILAILSAVAVITSTNPVLAIIFLIIVFINAALYLILNGLGFIGISYIIVYIGAITVFFLFVIMMISTEIIDTVAIGAEFGKILPLVYSISVLFLFLFILFLPSFLFSETSNINSSGITSEILYFINTSLTDTNFILNIDSVSESNIVKNILNIIDNNTNMTVSNPDSFVVPVLQIQILSEAVYGFVAFLLILTSFLLLLAMICPILLTRK